MVSCDSGSSNCNQRPEPIPLSLKISPIPASRNDSVTTNDSRSTAVAYSWADPVHSISLPMQKSIDELGLYELGESKRSNPPNSPIIKTENLEGG